jgi:hypothetical protein
MAQKTDARKLKRFGKWQLEPQLLGSREPIRHEPFTASLVDWRTRSVRDHDP